MSVGKSSIDNGYFYCPYVPTETDEQELYRVLLMLQEKYPEVFGSCQFSIRKEVNWGAIHQLMLEEFPEIVAELMAHAKLGIKCIKYPTEKHIRLQKIAYDL